MSFKFRRTRILLILYLNFYFSPTRAENNTIHILYTNDVQNVISDNALTAAVKYLQQVDNGGFYFNVTKVTSTNIDENIFFGNLCRTYEDMLRNEIPPIMAIDATVAGIEAEGANVFTAAMGLPTVSTTCGAEGDLVGWTDLTDDQKKYLVQISSPTDLIPEIIPAIISLQNISTAAIYTDKFFDVEHKYKSLLQNLPVRYTMLYLEEKSVLRQLLRLKTMGLFNIFFIGTLANINLVLNAAEALNLLQSNYAWHVITHEDGELECETCSDSRVMYIKPCNKNIRQVDKNLFKEFYYQLHFMSLKAAKKIFTENLMDNATYLNSCSSFDGTNTPQRNSVDLRALLKQENQRGSFNITINGLSSMVFQMNITVATFKEGSIINHKPLGMWQAGYYQPLILFNPEQFKNYAVIKKYRVITLVKHPLVYKDPSAPKGFKGYCIDLLDELARELNFQYEIFEVIDGNIGIINNDGIWNGMIKELIMKRADIALGSIAITSQRNNVVDFTVPIYEMVGYSILMKKTWIKPSLYRFLEIFEYQVWITIISIYLLTSTFIWILYKLSPFGGSYVKSMKNKTKLRHFTLSESFFYCLLSMTPQGAGESPVNSSGRVLAASWWLFSFIIVSSYCANLSAYITISRAEPKIKSLANLVNQQKIRYSTIKNTPPARYFQRMAYIENLMYEKWLDTALNTSMSPKEKSKLSVFEYPLNDRFTKTWNYINAKGFAKNITEALSLVRFSPSESVGFAIILETIDALYYELINCDFQVIDEFSKQTIAIALQKNSYLTGPLSNAILNLINRRFLQELKDKWWDNNPEKMDCGFKSSESISIENLGGIFIFVAASLIFIFLRVSFVILFKSRKKRMVDFEE